MISPCLIKLYIGSTHLLFMINIIKWNIGMSELTINFAFDKNNFEWQNHSSVDMTMFILKLSNPWNKNKIYFLHEIFLIP